MATHFLPVVRNLTDAEKSLARTVYRDAINLDLVEIRHQNSWPFQSRDVVMASRGNLYFHPHGHLWRADFAAADVTMRAFFIHELCHVWQAQRTGFMPLLRRPFARCRYSLKLGKRLQSYGIGQQAEIVTNTYLAREGFRPMEADEYASHELLISQIQ